MHTYLDELTKVLQTDERLVNADGKLLKTKIGEHARQLDVELIRLLLASDKLKGFFFKEIDNVLVFDLDKFLNFIHNEAFLADSYTAFKNKIGLATSKNNYLSESSDVVLNWPYKDCVLEGGQDKEDQKRDEVFWNETLGADQRDVLLAPKVLAGFKRYDRSGEHEVSELSEDDNFIIRGNNLLALHTLKKRYAGKVKLIYIDPPYNTDTDTFKYNDSFNHSAWLTFMKNRLTISRDFLSDDGAIYVNLDFNEVHYAKILMDEVFGRKNFQREIIWRIGWLSGYKTTGNNYIRNHDSILFYSKTGAVSFHKKYINNNEFKEIVKPDELKNKLDEFGLTRYQQKELVEVINHESRPDKYPIEDVWNASEYDDLNSVAIVSFAGETVSKLLNDKNKEIKGQKSEKLLKRIIDSHTTKGDLVMDFYLGSGTTAAVAHKMGCRYIGVEQMSYIEDITKARLKAVIAGDQSGVSKSVDWQGGGSFVYAYLKNDVNTFTKEVERAKDKSTVEGLLQTVLASNFLSHRVDPKSFEKETFGKLTLDAQKHLLIDLVNKNKLYVNYHDIDDESYGVDEKTKKLNHWMQSRD